MRNYLLQCSRCILLYDSMLFIALSADLSSKLELNVALEPDDCSNSGQSSDRCWLNIVCYNVLPCITRFFTVKNKWCSQTCTTCLLWSEAYSPPLNLNFLYLSIMNSTSSVIWPYEFNSIHCTFVHILISSFTWILVPANILLIYIL